MIADRGSKARPTIIINIGLENMCAGFIVADDELQVHAERLVSLDQAYLG